MVFNRVARVALLLLVLLPAGVLAQAGSSTISGVVKDATGGALPGASVTVVNEDTGVSIQTVTNDEGLYRVPALVPGRYRVETSLDGFDPAVRRPITLEVSQTLAIDIMLNVAGQAETVNVSAEAPPLVESLSSTVAQIVTREMLAALPLPNMKSAIAVLRAISILAL